MSENSLIEWTDSTFNAWRGCTKVSPACANCYAEALSIRWGGGKYQKGVPRIRTSAANWKLPLRWNRLVCDHCLTPALKGATPSFHQACQDAECRGSYRRRRVFCASLSDWLDEEVPIQWLADLLKLIHDTPNLDWLLLTKRPENWRNRLNESRSYWFVMGLIGLSHWIESWLSHNPPSNVWIGTTVENQDYDWRITELLKIPAKVRFLSVEPQLEEINLGLFGTIPKDICPHYTLTHQKIHWVINGGESGPRKRPIKLDWMRSIRDQCKEAGVAYFAKQIDKGQPIPADLMIRQYPKVTQ